MTEWGVFEIISAIVGLFLAVGLPALRLNSTITRLSAWLDSLEKQTEADCKRNEQEHKELRGELNEHGERINNHETRLCVIEKGGGK